MCSSDLFEKAKQQGRFGSLGSGESVSKSHPDFKFTTPLQLWDVISKYKTKAKKFDADEITKIMEVATGTGEIWECCHKYLHLPDKKEEIEKIYQTVFDISEKRKERKEMEATIEGAKEEDLEKNLEELAKLDEKIETLSRETIQYEDTMGTPQTKRIIDTHQYKYMDSIDKFNKISNPLDKIKKIKEGIIKTHDSLEAIQYRQNPVVAQSPGIGVRSPATTNVSEIHSPTVPRVRSGSRGRKRTGSLSDTFNNENDGDTNKRKQEEDELKDAIIASLKEENASLNKQLAVIQKERSVKVSAFTDQSKDGNDGNTEDVSSPEKKRQRSTYTCKKCGKTIKEDGGNWYVVEGDGSGSGGRKHSTPPDCNLASSPRRGGMNIKMKYNTTQKIKRKKGRKSQNKRKKKGRGSRKHGKRKHRNTRKKALKIEH